MPSGRDAAPGGGAGLAVLVAGSLLTAAALTLVGTAFPGTRPASSRLAQVETDELGAAIASLDPVTGRQAADDARACRVPLASVSLATAGPPGSIVRVRSGGYVSPPIRLGAMPQRIAIPFPAPYPAGAGTIQIEGAAASVAAALSPRWDIPQLDGAAVHRVTWTQADAC